MEQNRKIVEEAFQKWQIGQGSVLDLMDDDGTVVIPGTAAHCGTMTKTHFLVATAVPFMSRFSKPPIPIPTLILADGKDVMVVAEAEGTTLNGASYRNNYVFVLEFSDEKLVKATEFLDMLAFNAVWDSVAPGPQVTEVLEPTQ